ncbi:MAG: DUF21 domain-containing protein [Bryobacterales bacterium]|nr:DUF21 domain-containing protein [Bryobacterales bacterium]
MATTGLEVPLVLLLVVANGIFSMAELAVVSSRKARLRQQAEDGSSGVEAALQLAANPHDLLSTVQVGITAISTIERSSRAALTPGFPSPTAFLMPWPASSMLENSSFRWTAAPLPSFESWHGSL